MMPTSKPELAVVIPVSSSVFSPAILSWMLGSALLLYGHEAAAQRGPPGRSNGADTGDPGTDAGFVVQPAEVTSAGRSPAFFRKLWWARQVAIKNGDRDLAKKKLAKLLATKTASGWPNFFIYGRALEREAAEAMGRAELAEALRLSEAAVILAPDSPSSHLTLAAARWEANEFLAAAGAVWRAVIVSTCEPPLLREHFGNAMLAMIVGVIVAAVGFCVMVVQRYGRALLHDVRHLLPRGAQAWQAALVAGGLFVVPILLRLGIAWLICWWIMALGLYYHPRERVAALLLLAAMASLAVFLPATTTYLGYAGSSSQKIYLAARSLDAEPLAAQMAAKPNPTADEKYALGLRAAWSGDPRLAAQWLESAVADGADDPELFTLLGNVRAQLSKQQAAIESYERAVQVDTASLIAYFNMSRVYFAIGEHQKGNSAYRKASAIDFDLAEKLAKTAKSLGRDYIVPAGVSRRLLALKVKPVASHALAVEEVWSWLAAVASRMVFAVGAILGIILVAAMAFLHKPLKLAITCPRCGMAGCRRCYPEMPDLNQCGQCYHAFISQDETEDQLRIEQEIASHRYRASSARMARLFSVAMAGAGHMSVGAPLRGLFLMVIFTSSLTGLLATIGMLPTPVRPAHTGLDTITIVVTATISLVTYVVALWDGARAS